MEDSIWRLKNSRIKQLCKLTWDKLPMDVKPVVSKGLTQISDVIEWSGYIRESLDSLGVRWNPAKFNDWGTITFSEKDCINLPDEIIVGAFVHELAHFYQSILTPGNTCLIENAGDVLPKIWGFRLEIEALSKKRDELNS